MKTITLVQVSIAQVFRSGFEALTRLCNGVHHCSPSQLLKTQSETSQRSEIPPSPHRKSINAGFGGRVIYDITQ